MQKLICRISLRNIKQNKGRTFSIFLGIFLATFILTLLISTYYCIEESIGQLLRSGRSWDGDAGIYVYTQDMEKKIENANSVREYCKGYHLGEILENGYVQTEVAYYTQKIAKWMRCNLVDGNMPEDMMDIVVSDDFLKKNQIEYSYGQNIDISYEIAGNKIIDTFRIVGYYSKQTSVKDMILVSKNYYEEKKEEYKKNGKTDRDFPVLVEVQFKKTHDFKQLTNNLLSKISLDPSTAEYIINEEIKNPLEGQLVILLIFFLTIIILIEYIWVSNIYYISLNKDIYLYRSLRNLGVTKKQIGSILYMQMNVVYIPAIIIGMTVGWIFSHTVLLSFLTRITLLKFTSFISLRLMSVLVLFYYIILLLCQLKVKKRLDKNIYNQQLKTIFNYKEKDGKHITNMLHRITWRRLYVHKKYVVTIIVMLFSGVLIGNILYTYIRGFDVEQYISSTLLADYIVHSETFSNEIENRKNFDLSELDKTNNLEGMLDEGGAAVQPINIELDDLIQKQYDKLVEKSSNKYGNMYTYLYGMDEIMLKHIKVLKGNLNLEAYSSGNYVLIDSLGLEDSGESCWNVGDQIELPTTGGNKKNYTVMAIVSLPYDLSYQSKWEGSSNIFLPMEEWRRDTGLDDYYVYLFNIEDNKTALWDQILEEIVNNDDKIVYESAKTKLSENMKYFQGLKIGLFVLMSIIILATISAYFNIMINEIINSKEESINLLKLGVKKKLLLKEIIWEGGVYVFWAVVIGAISSPIITRFIINNILRSQYIIFGIYEVISLIYLISGIIAIIIICWLYNHIVDMKK